jgi:SSS family solute:Na+ symporter
MVHASIHIVDWLIIIITFVVTIGIGLLFSKKQKDTGNYFKAGGKIPSWAIGMSILATLISSVTFLAYPGEGYATNWIRLVQGLMVPVVLIFIVGIIVPLFRKVIRLSAYEYFERRFGFPARLYASLGFVLNHFAKMGTVFYLIALPLNGMTGMNTILIILIIGIIVVSITMLGGMEAVIWLDVIQGFLLIVGGLLSLGIILFSVDGGPAAIWEVAMENNKIGLGPFNLEFVHLTFWVMALNGIFYAIQKYGTDQTIVQRYLTARSDKDAVKASLIGVLLSVPVWALFMFIGTALFAYYKIMGGLPDNIVAEQVFPHFIMSKLPVGVVGLILSALIAAAFSSLDSDLNCLSAICLEDYYLRWKPDTPEEKQLFLGRIFTAFAGVGAILVAVFYVLAGGEGVLGIIFTLYAIFSGGIAGMFLLGIFSRRVNRIGIYTGMAASVIFTLYALLSSTPIGLGDHKVLVLDLGNLNFNQHKYMIGVYSHLVLMVVGLLTSLVFREKPVDEDLTYYGWLKLKRENKTP